MTGAGAWPPRPATARMSAPRTVAHLRMVEIFLIIHSSVVAAARCSVSPRHHVEACTLGRGRDRNDVSHFAAGIHETADDSSQHRVKSPDPRPRGHTIDDGWPRWHVGTIHGLTPEV